jgi:hypothetical protein
VRGAAQKSAVRMKMPATSFITFITSSSAQNENKKDKASYFSSAQRLF